MYQRNVLSKTVFVVYQDHYNARCNKNNYIIIFEYIFSHRDSFIQHYFYSLLIGFALGCLFSLFFLFRCLWVTITFFSLSTMTYDFFFCQFIMFGRLVDLYYANEAVFFPLNLRKALHYDLYGSIMFNLESQKFSVINLHY